MFKNIPDQTGIAASIKTTVISGFAGILSGMAQWNWPAIIASTVAIAGLAINFYFQKRKDRRDKERREAEKLLAEERLQMERELNIARIEALRRGCDACAKE